MPSKIILGSGLVGLICRKILGSDWTIIPIGPSRFYANDVPALGDDFIIYDDKVREIVSDWNITQEKIPLFFKRPVSYTGELTYSNIFIEQYLEKIGLESNPQVMDYYKSDFTVFPFSCLQLHRKLLNEFVGEIKSFYPKHKDANKIAAIKDNEIILDNGDRIEYSDMVSTIPYHALTQMLGTECYKTFFDSYFYLIRDQNIDLEGAGQALVADIDIPFHKCTKIKDQIYLIECLEYDEEIYNRLVPILGAQFDILQAKALRNSHVIKGITNEEILKDNNIVCVGSYAQCDPLIDIGSAIKRVHNLLSKRTLMQ